MSHRLSQLYLPFEPLILIESVKQLPREMIRTTKSQDIIS